ncbi:uncharacterized protein LOC119735339 [Patiria miniata]|uniref:Replication protein A OB domain-containing protein n=1 Tax=Patiria miniata TaxID=46514 RepID=A0A914AMJ8_PATMI|nr:uncharacterized protein LOC119735339 [Patiria miniata]
MEGASESRGVQGSQDKMPKLQDILDHHHSNPQHISVLICDKEDSDQATASNGIKFAIADSTTCCECIMYDVSKLPKMTLGSSIALINPMVKQSPQQQILILKRTRVISAGKVEVPTEIAERAKTLLHPQPAPFIEICDIPTSPLSKMVSVKGKVIGQEVPQTVISNGRQTKVKNITLKSHDSTCRIALWRSFVDQEVKDGEILQVTNTVTSEFRNEVYLSTTGLTTVKKLDITQMKETTTVIGFEVLEWDTSAFQVTTDQERYPSYLIEKEQLAALFSVPEEDAEKTLQQNIPFTCNITVSDNKITTISFD